MTLRATSAWPYTTVCDLIMHNLQEKRVVLIAQDSFYRGLTPTEHANVSVGWCKLKPVLKAPDFSANTKIR